MRPAAFLNIQVEANTRKAAASLRSFDSQLAKAGTAAKKATGNTSKFGSAASRAAPATGKLATNTAKYGVAAARAGTPTAKLASNTSRLGSASKSSSPAVGKLSKELKGAAKGAVALAAGYVGLGAVKGAITDTIDLGKATDRLNTLTGLSIHTASEWIETAKQRNIQSTQLNMGFITLSKNIKAATEASGTQRDIFDDLGISMERLRRMNFQQTLLAIGDAVKKIPGSERGALISKLFGRSAQSLAVLLSSGSKGIKEQLGLVEKHGAALDKNEIEKTKKAAAAQRELGLAYDGLKKKVTFALFDAGVAVKKFFAKLDVGTVLTKNDLQTIGKAAKLFARIFTTTIRGAIEGMAQALKGAVGVIRGVVKLIGDVLHLRFAKAWGDVKDIFKSGAQMIIGSLKAITAPARAIAGAIGNALSKTFASAWKKIVGIFRGGANAVIDIVNAIIDVINVIPGVPDIGKVGAIGGGGGGGSGNTSGAGGKGKGWGGSGFATGGAVTRPMAIVGEEAPRHHEWVIATNPAYKQNNLRYWAAAGKDLGVPGFGLGGLASGVGSAVGGAASSLGSKALGVGADLLGKGAGFFLDKLPNPADYLPTWIAGLGNYVVDKVGDWIKSGFSSGHLGGPKPGAGGGGAFTGPPPSFQQLANNAWVDAHTTRVAGWVANKFGMALTSGYRSPAYNASIGGAQGSYHTHGTPANPGAWDISYGGATQAGLEGVRSYMASHVAGIAEGPLIDNVAGWNMHTGFFRKGGRLARFAGGGSIDWRKIFGTSFSADEMASLAFWAGAKSPGLMSQIGMGESSGNPFAVGDAGDSIGLWQIDTAFHPQYSKSWLRNPLNNARAMAAIQASEGVGAWHASPTGAKGRVIPRLLAALRGKGGGGGGGGPKFTPHTGVGGQMFSGPGGAFPVKGTHQGVGGASPASLPGLGPTALPAGGAGLPGWAKSLLRTPGISYEGKMGVLESALGEAGSTPGTADDLAALTVKMGLLTGNKNRLLLKLASINRKLRQRGLTPKQRTALLAQQATVLSNLGSTTGEIQSTREAIQGLKEPSLSEETGQALEEQLQRMNDLLKEQVANQQALYNVSQSQYSVLAQAIAAVASGQIGGAAGLGFSAPATPGTTASY